jgi:hypothetical protein
MSGIKISLFSQVLHLIDRSIFNKVVKVHDTDKYSKGINSWTHLVTMIFMHLAKADSLRDISNGLRSATGNLSHLGISKAPCKSSISYINKNRNCHIFRDLYFALLDKYESSLLRRRQYARRIKKQIFLMDSSTIPLCLSLFDWAKFRSKKGAIKLHAVLDYDLGLPSYAVITEGKTHDVNTARNIEFPRDSVLVMDRAYVDFSWLYNLDSKGVFFVTRLKSNVLIEIAQRYLTDEKQEHLLSDEDIRLTGFYAANKYPKQLRIVKVYDEKNDKILIILTNQMSWTAGTISELYKSRWDVEVFFKHIKQLLKVKSFVGTSENAVRIQMWTALITILLLRYLKNKATYHWHLSNLVSFLRINLFVKIDLYQWLNQPIIKIEKQPPDIGLFTV